MSDFAPVWRAFRGHWVDVTVILALLLVASAVALAPPYLGKLLFDRGVLSGNSAAIGLYAGLAIGAYGVMAVLQLLGRRRFAVTSNQLSVRIKTEALHHLLQLPLEFFDKHKSGYVANRLQEVDTLGGLFSPTLFQFFTSLVQFAGALAIMFSISPAISAIALAFAPVFWLVSRWMSHRLRASTRTLLEASADLRGSLQETVAGVQVLKETGASAPQAEEVARRFASVAAQRVRQNVSMGAGMQSVTFVASIAAVVVLMLSGFAIVRGKLTMGDYVALAAYSGKLFAPAQLFGTFVLTVQPALVALRRLGTILRRPPETELWGSHRVDKIQGDIEFRDVRFAYEGSHDAVLDQCALQIDRGDCVSILGENGSGKSTLVKLLLGFYADYQGEIFVDGMNLREYDIVAFRKRIGIVSQNVSLFSGSVLDNVRMAAPAVSTEALSQALERSGCVRLFGASAAHHVVAEGGRNLSGGERQAVAIARCLVRDPDLLVFDEATAHLDETARKLVMQALEETFGHKTRVLITHDVEVAQLASKVYRLSGGRVSAM
jgi:ATP-binding cassette subfamily B protein